MEAVLGLEERLEGEVGVRKERRRGKVLFLFDEDEEEEEIDGVGAARMMAGTASMICPVLLARSTNLVVSPSQSLKSGEVVR